MPTQQYPGSDTLSQTSTVKSHSSLIIAHIQTTTYATPINGRRTMVRKAPQIPLIILTHFFDFDIGTSLY
jgi:hypothetical protein